MVPIDKIPGPTPAAPLSPLEPRAVRTGHSPATIPAQTAVERFAEMPREELRPLFSSLVQQHWNAPEELAALVARGLREGWAGESLAAARQLARIDPQPERGARLLATALLQVGSFAEAEQILTEALRLPGANQGTLLTLLARAQIGRGDLVAAERSVWRALQIDPNNEDALISYTALQRDRVGVAATELQAYRRAAELPGSWRAPLWLARTSLENAGTGTPAALALYQKILLRVPPIPAEALAQIQRDVTRAGLLKELVVLSAPQFDAARHGLPVGSALLKASLGLGDIDGARRILDLLRAQQKPEWRERLLIWEREIDKPYQGNRPLPEAPARTDLPTEAKTPVTTPASNPETPLPRDPQIARAVLPSATTPGPTPGARFAEMPREELRALFASYVQEHWDAPDELAALVTRALREGWTGDTLTAARQLVRIDPQPERGARLLATVLLQVGSFAEAEQILAGVLRLPGADQGVLLTLLARAQIGRGDLGGAERSLWQALQADPDSEDALFSLAALHRERGGSPAEADAFRRVADGPGSWRAPLWLAQTSLHPEHRDVPAALALYEKVLQQNPPAPPEALAQISRDLAKHGLLKELIALCAPRFDAARHGLPVAGILLSACFDAQDTAAAQRLLDLLYAQQRPEWRERLLFWERELDKRYQGYRPPGGTSPKSEESGEAMRILSVEGPIWALGGDGGDSAAGRDVLPEKSADAVRVAFFCGSLGMPDAAHSADPSLAPPPATELGRFTRGLPLFLAERVHLQTTAAASTLVPRSNAGGFILAGQPWTSAALAVMPTLEKSCRPDYIVLFHLVTSRDSSWQAQFRIENLGDQKSDAITWEETFEPDQLASAVDSMVQRVLRELGGSVPGISLQPAPAHRPPPPLDDLLAYLSRLEQALTAWCAPRRAISQE